MAKLGQTDPGREVAPGLERLIDAAIDQPPEVRESTQIGADEIDRSGIDPEHDEWSSAHDSTLGPPRVPSEAPRSRHFKHIRCWHSQAPGVRVRTKSGQE